MSEPLKGSGLDRSCFVPISKQASKKAGALAGLGLLVGFGVMVAMSPDYEDVPPMPGERPALAVGDRATLGMAGQLVLMTAAEDWAAYREAVGLANSGKPGSQVLLSDLEMEGAVLGAPGGSEAIIAGVGREMVQVRLGDTRRGWVARELVRPTR